MRAPLLLLVFGPALFAQTIVEGVVVDAATHMPVAGARVALSTFPRRTTAVTGASGRFRISPATSGYYQIDVTCVGYLNYSRWPHQDEPASDLTIELTRQSVISGKLDDEDGFPVEGARVDVFSYTSAGGIEKRVSGAISDDRGRFRVAGLRAGSYYVRATPHQLSRWDKRYWPEYFPGTIEPGETGLIELGPGQERGGVDIHFTKHEGVTVSGSVLLPARSAIPPNLNIYMQSGADITYAKTVLSPSPSFTFPHVAPGKYVLRVESANMSGEQRFEVRGSDVTGLVIPVSAVEPVTLHGSVAFDPGTPRDRVIVAVFATNGPAQSAMTDEDGSFAIKGLLPDHYRVMVQPGNGPYVYATSARLGNRDVLMDGFDVTGASPGELRVTASSAKGTVRGILLDSSGRPAAYGVVQFVGKLPQNTRRSSTDAKGAFEVSAPLGEYRIIAVLSEEQLDSLESAGYIKTHQNDFPPVRIVEGENNAPLTLRLPAAR